MNAHSESEQRRVDAFLRLSRLERSLRLYIQDELTRIHGSNWMRSLPKDVKENLGEMDLSYSNFPDLRKILSVNWRQLNIDSPYKKDHVLNHLEGLEPIRNDIAHSRDVSQGALSMVDAAFFVVGTLTQLPASAPDLPATSFIGVAVSRIRSAIEHDGEIGQADVDALVGRDMPDLVETIEKFRRVKARPGRSVKLMSETKSEALNMIQRMSEDTLHA